MLGSLLLGWQAQVMGVLFLRSSYEDVSVTDTERILGCSTNFAEPSMFISDSSYSVDRSWRPAHHHRRRRRLP